MIKNRFLIIPLALFACVIPNNAIQHLSEFNFTSASVLPVFSRGNALYLIVAREIEGKSRGLYDDFGGGREKNEHHPVVTAAREFFEEAILSLTIGLSLREVQNYIDTYNTKYIICHTKNERSKSVTYITQFNRYYKELLRNFYTARNKVKEAAYREKDHIAVIKWNQLEKTIARTRKIKKTTITAWVIDPLTGNWNKKRIKLRASFVRKFKPFFLGRSYEKEWDQRIRFYD